ncbi:hypothetical protein BDV28DRAFT_99596 [Aspergillus coremiiformis]|uniref:Uncharacterized protein n=1 Tax=Aspergillus coremiiformis TaxID=138285 RepID=A0A5N6YS89_9EURO|nr:hypothetical protein BDV28DRAFT_99596 [Aspergillus coremiiformis]
MTRRLISSPNAVFLDYAAGQKDPIKRKKKEKTKINTNEKEKKRKKKEKPHNSNRSVAPPPLIISILRTPYSISSTQFSILSTPCGAFLSGPSFYSSLLATASSAMDADDSFRLFPAPVMLAGDSPLSMSAHNVMGPVRRGPIRDYAVGQFVNDVPAPMPELQLETLLSNWVMDEVRYVASVGSRNELFADWWAFAA